MSDHMQMHDDFLSVYLDLDNVDVASQTWEEHIRHVKIVLERCHMAGLKLKLTKCSFAGKSAHCLGFVVDAEGIHTDPEKVAAILHLPAPSNVADIPTLIPGHDELLWPHDSTLGVHHTSAT